MFGKDRVETLRFSSVCRTVFAFSSASCLCAPTLFRSVSSRCLFRLEMEAMEAVALFDYTGRNNEELSFKKNELLSISKKLTPEWWLGQAADGHQSGFIPDGYLTFQRRLVTRQRQQSDNCMRQQGERESS